MNEQPHPYETPYPVGSEALRNVRPEYFDGTFTPLGRGMGIPTQATAAGDVYPLQGDAEYRGWYHMTGTTKSRWCPKQSKFEGPRPGGAKHAGADLFSHRRETLLAITAGTIEYRPPQPAGWGNHIYLYFKRGGVKYVAVYAHIDASSQFSGPKSVVAGESIGSAGCSGNAGDAGACWRTFRCHDKIAAEDHLHLELFRADDPDVKLDPIAFFGWTVKFSDDQSCSECGSTSQLI